MFSEIFKKQARNLGFAEIHTKDFSSESHCTYYEYFYDESGKWLVRFYNHDTNKLVKETTGNAADAKTARKKAQSSIRKVMRSFKRKQVI